MFTILRPLLQKLVLPDFQNRDIHVYVLRDDLNHLVIQGNKARKLKYNLLEAKRLNSNRILTFGGAWSNHIYSTSYAAREAGFHSIGVIRGERPKQLSDTLKFAEEQGMILHFVSREKYKEYTSGENLNELTEYFGDFFLIPEGGSNDWGVMGCQEIVNDIPLKFNYLCCSAGTGATAAGLLSSMNSPQELLVFPALRNGDFLREQIIKFCKLKKEQKLTMMNHYHFGGYAKYTPELLDFISFFENTFKIPLDFVYTAKMMFGVFDLLKTNFFKPGSVIIVYHSGGLQGKAGLTFQRK